MGSSRTRIRCRIMEGGVLCWTRKYFSRVSGGDESFPFSRGKIIYHIELESLMKVKGVLFYIGKGSLRGAANT